MRNAVATGFLAGALLIMPASGQTDAPAAAPAAPQAEFSKDQLLETWGWFLAQEIGLTALDLTDEEVQAITRGLADAVDGGEAPHPVEQVGPQLQQFLQTRHERVLTEQREEGARQSAAYFQQLEQNPAVKKTESGLRYEIVEPGSGPTPRPEDRVRAHYTGKLTDGTTFDSSHQRGEPIEFVLSEVISGWTEGLQLVQEGGTIRLYVPPDLAYGDRSPPGIPPAATLVFEIELLKVNPEQPANAAEAPPAPSAP